MQAFSWGWGMPGVPVSGVLEALAHLGQVELGWALERWAGPDSRESDG